MTTQNRLCTILVLVLGVVFTNAYTYISSIDVDPTVGKVFVGENQGDRAVLYEVDTELGVQTGIHKFNSKYLSDGSLFDAKRGNKRALYAILEDDSKVDLAYFDVPLANQPTLTPTTREQVGTRGLSLFPTYNIQNNVAVLGVSRDLVLVDLSTQNVVATKKSYFRTRTFGHNLVYNPNNKHLVVFYTYASVGAPYGLSVDEFDLSEGSFKSIKGTYDCKCETQPRQSPFYDTIFVDQNCEIDTTVTPQRIWCADSENSKFFSFKHNDLTDYVIGKIDAKFDTVAWDFANRRAYGIKSAANGFKVHKININNNNVISTLTNTDAVVIDSTVFKYNQAGNRLYIAVDNNGDAEKSQIVQVNTATMANSRIINLNDSSL